MYKILTGCTESRVRSSWRWMWRLPCSQRIRAWWWEVLKQCVPTRVFSHAMRLASTMMCHCCGHEAEGIQHLLLRCPWSVEVWRELELGVDWQQGPVFFTSWVELLRRMGRSNIREEQQKLCSIIYIVWEICKQRNEWIIQGL